MKWLQTILDGIYPTHEAWLLRSWLIIIGFEIIVVMVEVGLICLYLNSQKLKKVEDLGSGIILIVIFGNIITFFLGFLLQVLLVGL